MSLTSYRAAPPRDDRPGLLALGREDRSGSTGMSLDELRVRSGSGPRGAADGWKRDLGEACWAGFHDGGRGGDRLGWPGNDLLSQALRHSTIGAEVFDGRVRDGIGSGHVAKVTRPAKPTLNEQ